MTGTQGMKKKEDITSIINRVFDEAMKTRAGFTPENVREFEATGMRAAEARRDVQRQAPPRQREEGMREVTPSRQLNIVVRRAEETTKQREAISPVMTRRAIESAVRIGEMLEIAAVAPEGKLNLRKWVSG